MAVLESMSKGIALVTTAVGQAKDLVKHGQNAMMAPIDAVEELAQFSREIIQGEALKKTLVQAGFLTARDNSLTAQLPLWRDYFKNLINS